MHKMNVKLAAQILRSSVASALEFLRDDLKQQEFKGSEGTVLFIRAVDKAFDILNSRTPHANGYKAPIKQATINMQEKALKSTADLLLSAKTTKGSPIVRSKRKTGFLCFSMSIKSIISMAKKLLFRQVHPLSYLLTYCLSQEYVEVFFSCIRARNGWNNNPNSVQFQSSIKSMLFSNLVKASLEASCVQYDQAAHTPIFSMKWSKRQSPLKEIEIPLDDTNENPIDINTTSSLSPFKHNVLYYISGYICHKIQSSITCAMCAFAILQYLPKSLEDHNYHLTDIVCKLTSRKNNGGLVFASNGVYEIVKRCERLFTINVLNSHSKITSEQGICKKLIILCVLELSARAECLFPNLKSSCLVPEDPASADSHAV